MADIFICYSNEDAQAAEEVCAGLEKKGLRCWIAPRDIPQGKSWTKALAEGVKECRVAILVFSKDSNRSQTVDDEVALAFDNDLKILPVRLKDVTPNPALARLTEKVQWVDASQGRLREQLDEIVSRAMELLGETAAAADAHAQESQREEGQETPASQAKPEAHDLPGAPQAWKPAQFHEEPLPTRSLTPQAGGSPVVHQPATPQPMQQPLVTPVSPQVPVPQPNRVISDASVISINIREGPLKGEVFRYSGHASFIVGRGQRSHLRIPDGDQFFSRYHFMVEVNPPLCRLTDLGSTNGTYVNGKKLEVADLHHGDVIHAGETIIEIYFVQEEDSSGKELTEPTATSTPADTEPATQPYPQKRARQDPVNEETGYGTMELGPQAEKFEILKKLGEGNTAVTYLATGPSKTHKYVLKGIGVEQSVPPEGYEPFLEKASAIREIHHPCVLPLLECGQSLTGLYFATPYVGDPDAAA